MAFPDLRATVVDVVGVRFDADGALVEHWGLLDRLGVLEQLGALKL